jgi:lactose/L-arabinose transport system ATP-binding protein
MSHLTLRNIRKSFGAIDVIKGVDLDIRSGELVVFVGPSGCGKSTLLRMTAGLEDISAGTLEIDGARMNDVDPSKRGIAMVFQSYALYPHMTVRQNMGFALRFAGESKVEIDRRVNEAARILELAPLLDRKPGQLSGGQRQRVAIGRAIVRQPKVFLFDEPLSNLDAELRVNMRVEIARLHKRLGATIIYVTHDQVEAMTLADKIVVLRGGMVEQVGAPLDVYDDPANMFVAGFIGSPKMNFFTGKVAESDHGRCAVRLSCFDGATVPLSLRSKPPEPGTEVILGLRPEHFGGDDASVCLKLTIDMVEHLGGDSFAYAHNGQDKPIIIKMRGGRDHRPGDLIEARFAPAKALLFNDEGRRLP